MQTTAAPYLVICLIFLIVFVCVLIGGCILLIVGIKSTVKGKKRIGAIVGGAIMIFFGGFFAIGSLMFMSIGGMAVATSKDADTNRHFERIQTALEKSDRDALYGEFAHYSYSGEDIPPTAADKIIALLGDELGVEGKMTGFSSHNKVEVVHFVYHVINSAGEKYSVTCECITKASNENYIGIQYISITQSGKTELEFGTKPDFGN